DGLAQRAQQKHRNKNGERDGNGNHDGGTPVPQKHQDHHRGESGSDQCFLQYAIDGSAHEQGLIEERLDGDVAGQGQRGDWQNVLHSVHNAKRGRSADLVDRHQRATDPVLAHNVGLRRKAVANVGDVTQVNRRAVHRLDRQVVQIGDGLRTAVHLDLIFQRPDLGRAAGSNQVLRVNGVDDVGGREPVGLQPWQVEVNLDLAYLAAIGVGHGRAVDGRQLSAQKILPQV